MKAYTIDEIQKAVKGERLCGNPGEICRKICIDSRKAETGDLFFALIGERLDGHDFVSEAARAGAQSFVVSHREAAKNLGCCNVILVEDTTRALQELARDYLSGLSVRKVAITGSTGKTTTKDILHAILSKRWKCAKTTGNLNNHIGLPLTILGLAEDTEAAVLEMGTEAIGEIHLLADLARPDIAIITNIGISHIETFGSRENILRGKLEITDFFREENLLIVNQESDLLSRENTGGPYRLLTLGKSGKSDYILSDVEDHGEEGVSFVLEYKESRQRFTLGIPGRHNAVNASLAIAAAADLGMAFEEAVEGLLHVDLTEKRLSIKGRDGLKIIDDTYNASPDSMKAGIDVLLSTKGMRKVALLSDMLGLGEESERCHRQVGEYAAGAGVDLLITIGDMAKQTSEAASRICGKEKVLHFDSRDEFTNEMNRLIAPGDVVLVKGSRATAMDQVVKKIMESWEKI